MKSAAAAAATAKEMTKTVTQAIPEYEVLCPHSASEKCVPGIISTNP